MTEHTSEPGRSGDDLLWKQLSLYIDLFKFYFDQCLKVNALYYGVTGAICTYHFQNPAHAVGRYALLLPIAFSFALGALQIAGASQISVLGEQVTCLANDLGWNSAPEVHGLTVMLRSLGATAVAVGLGLSLLFLTSQR